VGTAVTAAGLTVALGLGTQAGVAAAADDPYQVPSANNPNLPSTCGLDVVIAIDASYSIKNAGRLTAMKNAALGLVSAFADKNTRVGLVTFTATAKEALPLTYVTSQSVKLDGAHGMVIGNSPKTGYKSGAGTDWQDAMRSVSNELSGARSGVAKLAIVISDGAPTEYTASNGTTISTHGGKHTSQSVDAATTVVNQQLKAKGVHMLAIGTGKALTDTDANNRYQNALKQISGPDAVPPSGFNAATTDLVLQENLTALVTQFRTFAGQALASSGCSFLAVSPSPSTLKFGNRAVTVNATLTSGAGAISGAAVKLQTRVGSKPWKTLGTRTTDSKGHVSIKTSTKKNRQFMATYAGGGGQNSVSSAPVQVTVAPLVTVSASQSRSGQAVKVHFSGKVKPKKAVKKAFLQKRMHGSWQNLDKTKLHNGRYSFDRAMTSKSKWRVFVKASKKYGAGHSKKIKIKV
jgi:hypothetical protein